MKIYLMRHADAELGDPMDPTRKLTGVGRRQARLMGKWLGNQLDKPTVVLESNMRRARQTAKRVAKRIDAETIRTPALDPDSTPAAAVDAIKKAGKHAGSVVAVTHDPLVKEIMGYITGGDPGQMHFAHAAIAHFELGRKGQKAAVAAAEAAGDYYYDEVEQKRWKLGDGGDSGNCDFCEENAALGWIDMDDVFDSPMGDIDEAPAHPNCDCGTEFKTRRVRVYAAAHPDISGKVLHEADRPHGLLHWVVTPKVVGADRGIEKKISREAATLIEASLTAAEVALIL